MQQDATDPPDDGAASGVDDLGQQVARAIGRIHRRFKSQRGDGELGDSAMSVLTLLYRQGPRSLTELSERERVTPGSMSQTVNRLTDAGYASRQADPSDGRRVLFTATPLGSGLAAEARERRYAWFNGHLSELSRKDQAALARAAEILEEIADS